MDGRLKKVFPMFRSIGFIFLFLLLGEGVKYLFDIPIAGNILGMALIFLALQSKYLPLAWVKPASDRLLDHMILFFVPYGVGLMVHFEMLREHWFPIALAVVISTLITLYISAVVQEKLEKK